MKLKRSQLYERIWADPVIHVAQTLNVGETTLINVCRRHHIPTPPPGYWRQVQVGKAVERIALPNPQDDLVLQLPNKRTAKLPAGDPAAESKTPKRGGESVVSPVPATPQARRGTSAQAGPGSATVAPAARVDSQGPAEQQDNAAPRALLQRLQAGDRREAFLRELQAAAKELDSQTCAVIQAWIERAHTEWELQELVASVVASCGRVARGETLVPWWPPGMGNASQGNAKR